MAPLPVAIIANAQTPYRLHVHQRIARELPDIQLYSIFTHELSEGANWKLTAPVEIGPVFFGQGQSSAAQSQWRNLLAEWRKGRKITRWLADHQVAAVILCGYNDPGRLRIIRWCQRRKIPWFLHGDSNIRNDRARGIKGWIKRQMLPRILRRCSGALPVGTAGMDYFQKYGVPPERCFLCPLEPDYRQIETISAEQIEAARTRFQLNAGRRRILFVGRLLQLKRVDLLIDAVAAIASSRPQWDLLIVGDGDLRAALETRVPQSLRDRVQWTGFLTDQGVVSALYHLCDVLALCSNQEAWGLVLNEAAAAGLALISSDVPGGAVDLIRPGINGFIFPSDDRAALSEALREVTDCATIDRLKAASPQVLADWRRQADAVEGVRSALASVGLLHSARINA